MVIEHRSLPGRPVTDLPEEQPKTDPMTLPEYVESKLGYTIIVPETHYRFQWLEDKSIWFILGGLASLILSFVLIPICPECFFIFLILAMILTFPIEMNKTTKYIDEPRVISEQDCMDFVDEYEQYLKVYKHLKSNK